MITLADGRVFDGTPLQILRGMKALAFRKGGTDSEYIDWVVENTLRYNDIQLSIIGESDEDRATSLLDELVRAGLATRS